MRLLFIFLFSIISYITIAQPTAQQIRDAIAGEIKSFNITPTSIFKIETRTLVNGNDSVKVRLYIPSAKKGLPIVYAIHGGALVAGDLETHDNVCRELAFYTQAIVVALDYRKPPEHPYPASLDDCAFVLNWIKKEAAGFGGDPKQIDIVGDSGGGLLATSLLVKLGKKAGVRKLALINPATDLRNVEDQFYQYVVNMYLGDKSPNDSLISPITATQFAHFPPTLIITSGKDILKPQADELIYRLQLAKVKVEVLNLPEADHLGGYWAAAHKEAQAAIESVAKFISPGLKIATK